jgi:hypothetical protein
MDVGYFLNKRTAFIRRFYAESASRFEEIKRQIELSLPPFDDPPDSEDPEPPFLEQWLDADSARDIAAMTCVSLLSDTLKLYFEALRVRVIGFNFGGRRDEAFRDGFVRAYLGALGEILQTDWSDCPADVGVIEQMVLARNRGQHGTSLTSIVANHDTKTLAKYPKPLFVSPEESRVWSESGGNPDSLLVPRIVITKESLFTAIEQVERLAAFIEGRMDKAWEWRRRDGRKE